MTQLTFVYGTMASGKSIEILKVAHNYEVQGRKPMLLTSALDDRTNVGEISSRIGLKQDAVIIQATDDLFEMVAGQAEQPALVLIDEAQFMTREQVMQLAHIVDDLDIPVMAFGLKNDFRNELFEGSKYLLLYADKIEEMKTICWFCHKKAIMNLHYIDGNPVYEGDQVQIGGNEAYYPVCRKHYFHPSMITEGE